VALIDFSFGIPPTHAMQLSWMEISCKRAVLAKLTPINEAKKYCGAKRAFYYQKIIVNLD
jgi:hypothetical protein